MGKSCSWFAKIPTCNLSAVWIRLITRLRKRKLLERNRIESAIGNNKNHYGLERIMYSIEGSDELWVSLGLLATNLKTVLTMA